MVKMLHRAHLQMQHSLANNEAVKTIKDLLVTFDWKPENIIELGDVTNSRGTEQLLPIWSG